jgi:hypothetical protein
MRVKLERAMTPEERRAEIDRKFPFQMDLPHRADDWDASREEMDFLVTFIGTFDMYVVTREGQTWVRYCFANAVDAELFRAFANKDNAPECSNVSTPQKCMAGGGDTRRDQGRKYPHHVDLPRLIHDSEADQIADYILSHIGWFHSYVVMGDGRPRMRFCFETVEKAEMFSKVFGGDAGCRSAA